MADGRDTGTGGLRGQFLMIEGARHTPGRRRSREPGSNLVPLAGLGVRQLFPATAAFSGQADFVQLPDAVQPHTVRGYLQNAAEVPGPLIVYVTGHLMVDRRRSEPHLALRDSTPATVRYDGLPWSWLGDILGTRGRGRTLVVCDLTSTEEAFARVNAHPDVLSDQLPLWGVVNPPRRKPAKDSGFPSFPSPFTRGFAEALRAGFGDAPDVVEAVDAHEAVVARAVGLDPDAVAWVPGRGAAPGLANAMPGVRPQTLRSALRRLKAVQDPPAGTSDVHPTRPTIVPGGIVPGTNVPGGIVRGPNVHTPNVPGDNVRGSTVPGPHVPPAPEPPPGYFRDIAEIRRAADAGRGTEAAERARVLAARMTTSVGPDHVWTLDARALTASVNAALGRLTEATLEYADVARRAAAAVGPSHPTTLAAVDNAHRAWARIADVHEAARLGPAVVDVRRLVPGRDGRDLRAAAAHLERVRALTSP